MRQAARITLFIHDRDGRLEATPDLEVLHLLLRQMPLMTRNDDGTRTFVFDLVEPSVELSRAGAEAPARPSLDRLRQLTQSLASEARSLGLPLAAALAEAAEVVADSETAARRPMHFA